MYFTTKWILSWIALISLSGDVSAFGQEATEAQYLGASRREEDAVKASDMIAIGRFRSLGVHESTRAGENYRHAVVVLGRVLKGAANGEIVASYGLNEGNQLGQREQLPRLDTDYVIFFQLDRFKAYRIRKLLPATNATIERIEAVITSQKAGSNPG